MKRIVALICGAFIVGSLSPISAQKPLTYLYEVSPTPWNESFGNHRAVLKIGKSAEVVSLKFEWRLRTGM